MGCIWILEGIRILEGAGSRAEGAGGGAVERWQVCQPFLQGELGVAGIHHDHAGQEPDEEQHAHAHPQPAVGEHEPAFDAGGLQQGQRLRLRRDFPPEWLPLELRVEAVFCSARVALAALRVCALGLLDGTCADEVLPA